MKLASTLCQSHGYRQSTNESSHCKLMSPNSTTCMTHNLANEVCRTLSTQYGYYRNIMRDEDNLVNMRLKHQINSRSQFSSMFTKTSNNQLPSRWVKSTENRGDLINNILFMRNKWRETPYKYDPFKVGQIDHNVENIHIIIIFQSRTNRSKWRKTQYKQHLSKRNK